MAVIKDDINLQQVREINDQIAREKGCSINQVEIKPVQTILGKGNNGTVGAYVKQVKQEFIDSKAYDRANISMRLKSAIMEEIDRFADNARDNANENLGTIEHDNQELRDMNIQAECTIADLQQGILNLKTTTAEELRKTADELLKNQQQLEASRESAAHLKTELEMCRSELKASTEKVEALAKLNGKLEAEVDSAKKESSDLAAQASQTNDAREEAERKAVNAEQASAFQQKAIGLLEAQKSALERDLQTIKDSLDELMTRYNALQEKYDNANQERISDLQKAVSGRHKPLPKKG